MCGARQRCHTIFDALGEELLLLLLFLELFAVARLKPAVARHVTVIIFVLSHRLHVLRDAANVWRLARLRRVIRRLDPAQWRARSEQLEQHGREFVRHGELGPELRAR